MGAVFELNALAGGGKDAGDAADIALRTHSDTDGLNHVGDQRAVIAGEFGTGSVVTGRRQHGHVGRVHGPGQALVLGHGHGGADDVAVGVVIAVAAALETDVLGVHEEVKNVPGLLVVDVAGVAETIGLDALCGHLAAGHEAWRAPRGAVVHAAALDDGVGLGCVTAVGAAVVGGQHDAVAQVGQCRDAVVGAQDRVNGGVAALGQHLLLVAWCRGCVRVGKSRGDHAGQHACRQCAGDCDRPGLLPSSQGIRGSHVVLSMRPSWRWFLRHDMTKIGPDVAHQT